ncbi:MAG: ATP-binding protein, partial [Myxococcaceae bacterium]
MRYNSWVGDGGVGVRRVLDPHPASVREARRCVRDELLRAEREDLVDTAELVVSELVTNAVVHVGAGIELAAWVDELGLRVEVADGSPHAPQARHHAVTAGTGRGLRMVAQLVDRWGSTPTASGKVVWFELARGDREPGGEDFLVAGVYDDEPVDDPLAGAPGDSHGDS